jgi:hypothetical protein
MRPQNAAQMSLTEALHITRATDFDLASRGHEPGELRRKAALHLADELERRIAIRNTAILISAGVQA